MPRTVIVGAGFGGTAVAHELRRLLGDEHHPGLVSTRRGTRGGPRDWCSAAPRPGRGRREHTGPQRRLVSVDPGTLATAYPGVFAVGDVTQIKLANGLPLPKAGIIAELEGSRVAAAIAADARGEGAPAPFDGRGHCFIDGPLQRDPDRGRVLRRTGALRADT